MVRRSFVFLTVGMMVFLFASMAWADVPHLVNYQGKLTDAGGGLVNDTLQMTFSIYPDTLGSPSEWSETQAQVIVENGIFNVLLGAVDTIPSAVFDGNVKYLGVQVESDVEMRPLKPMVSVPYAYRAGSTDGSGGGGGWVDDGTVVRLADSTDQVGIGTTTPSEKLEVAGNILLTKGTTRTLSVESASEPQSEGDDLKIHAGSSFGPDQMGGNVFIYGGLGEHPGIGGSNVILAHDGTDRIGNVGIGTANPDYHLDLYKLDAVAARFQSGTSNAFLVLDRGSSGAHGYVRFSVNNAEKWRVGQLGNDDFSIDYNEGTKTIFYANASGDVGIGTTNPQGALDVSSTTGAFIVPRMTTAQRDALTAVNGMIIYNTTTNQLNFYENGAWVTK